MNDHEIRKMKEQLTRLDDMLKVLAASKCSCMACLLAGCNCCEDKVDVDELVENYKSTAKAYRDEEKFYEDREENKEN
jgi:hypothetical protein